MCQKIDSTFILIHQLKNRESCSIKDIAHKKAIIEEEIPTVFVNTSKNSILNSVNCYPEIFKFENDLIMKNENSNDFFEEPLISYFNTDIDKSIRDKIENILEIV